MKKEYRIPREKVVAYIQASLLPVSQVERRRQQLRVSTTIPTEYLFAFFQLVAQEKQGKEE